MGISVGNRHGNEQCNNRTWGWILTLAEQFGWEPIGTLYPYEHRHNVLRRAGYKGDELRARLAGEAAEWDGGYWSNDAQIICGEDAAALANALAAALAAASGGSSECHDEASEQSERMTEEISTLLANLIDLCRTGSLMIL